MEKTITVFKNTKGYIYFIDNSADNQFVPDFIMIWETSELFFETLKKYQGEGYKLIFK